MSSFGFYFVGSLLHEAGWPRKQGLLGREVIDTTIVDSAIDHMTGWASALGAGRPRLALQVIAQMFGDRNWSAADAPSVAAFVQSVGSTDERPPRAPFKLAKSFGKSISRKDFEDSRLRLAMEQCCFFSLIWGLANPDRFARWYAAEAQKSLERLPFHKSVGWDIEAMPTMAEWIENSEQILRGYEMQVGELPPIPQRLLDEANALGWRLDR